jgi:hypothetical protein
MADMREMYSPEDEASDIESPKWVSIRCERMTMREWYAGLAMQGIVQAIIDNENYPNLKKETIANLAYGIADAMLVRAKNPK